jgi:hypothetical protein
MKKTILLFDMDGVLVEPGRYRASLENSLNFFGRNMGWDSLYPGEATIAWFESRGIISEWDIVPLFLAGTFETIIEKHPNLGFPADLISACETVKGVRIPKPRIEIENLIEKVPGLMKPGFTICDLVLNQADSKPGSKIFPRLSRSPLIGSILLNTRDIQKNMITRVFQEIFLGEDLFKESFHLPAICDDHATQYIVDNQLISPEWNEKLKNRWQDGLVYMAIYTARPSRVGSATENSIQFSPEADIVVDQLGWQNIPVIGLGQLHYAAGQIGCTADDLIKPSPIQALGAIGSALNLNPLPAIQAGWDLLIKNNTAYYDSFPELDVHIFEDSPSGIVGVKQAIDLLVRQGVSVTLNKWGISTDINKIDRLMELEARIMPSVNEALDTIEETDWFTK